MSSRWYTFEDVMETDKDGYCRISKEKLATCGFAQLQPGDIIGVTHTYERSTGEYLTVGTLFVKVVSVKMPRPHGLFHRSFPGSVIVALPSGERTELLQWDPLSWPSGICYFPTPKIYEYFRENCEADGSYIDLSRIIIYNGHEAALKEDMLAEKKRRENVRAARIEQYRNAEEERRKAQADEEEQARRNATAKASLDALFDSMDYMEHATFSCPNCTASCKVPVRGKNVLIHCTCGKDFEVFC